MNVELSPAFKRLKKEAKMLNINDFIKDKKDISKESIIASCKDLIHVMYHSNHYEGKAVEENIPKNAVVFLLHCIFILFKDDKNIEYTDKMKLIKIFCIIFSQADDSVSEIIYEDHIIEAVFLDFRIIECLLVSFSNSMNKKLKDHSMDFKDILQLKLMIKVFEFCYRLDYPDLGIANFFKILNEIEINLLDGCGSLNMNGLNSTQKQKLLSSWFKKIHEIDSNEVGNILSCIFKRKSIKESSSTKIEKMISRISIRDDRSSEKRLRKKKMFGDDEILYTRSSRKKQKEEEDKKDEEMKFSPIRLLNFDNIPVKADKNSFLNKKRYEKQEKQKSISKEKTKKDKIVLNSILKNSLNENSSENSEKCQFRNYNEKENPTVFTKEDKLYKQNFVRQNTKVNKCTKQRIFENETRKLKK